MRPADFDSIGPFLSCSILVSSGIAAKQPNGKGHSIRRARAPVPRDEDTIAALVERDNALQPKVALFLALPLSDITQLLTAQAFAHVSRVAFFDYLCYVQLVFLTCRYCADRVMYHCGWAKVSLCSLAASVFALESFSCFVRCQAEQTRISCCRCLCHEIASGFFILASSVS